MEHESAEALFCEFDDKAKELAKKKNEAETYEERKALDKAIKVGSAYFNPDWMVEQEEVRHSRRNSTWKWVAARPEVKTLDEWFKEQAQSYADKESVGF